MYAAVAENLVVLLGNMEDVELEIASKLSSTQSLEYKFNHQDLRNWHMVMSAHALTHHLNPSGTLTT